MGNVKISKKFREVGMIDDKCHAYAVEVCEDCGKAYCHNHCNRDKHKCDDKL